MQTKYTIFNTRWDMVIEVVLLEDESLLGKKSLSSFEISRLTLGQNWILAIVLCLYVTVQCSSMAIM